MIKKYDFHSWLRDPNNLVSYIYFTSLLFIFHYNSSRVEYILIIENVSVISVKKNVQEPSRSN